MRYDSVSWNFVTSVLSMADEVVTVQLQKMHCGGYLPKSTFVLLGID
jgi:hypothetical protein